MSTIYARQDIVQYKQVEFRISFAMPPSQGEKNTDAEGVKMCVAVIPARVLVRLFVKGRPQIGASLSYLSDLQSNPAVTLVWMQPGINIVNVI
jgi:hypothetical protein